MSAKLRRRGGVFHIEGTVRVGKASVRIRETTGCRDEKAALLLFKQRVAEVERQLLLGERTIGPRRIPDFATVATTYLDSAPHLGNQDRAKLLMLAEHFGDTPVNEIGAEDWKKFAEVNLTGRAPGTVRRWYAMFSAVMKQGSESHKFPLPSFPVPRETGQREIYLEPNDRDALIEAYEPHARPVAQMLCFQGCREFEALRLEWRDVSFERNTLYFRITKNGEARIVPMHPVVRKVLLNMRKPGASGAVFRSPTGQPYNDRREASHGDGPEGSGIRTAHATAVRRFTIRKLLETQPACPHCGCELLEIPGQPQSPVVRLIKPYSRGGKDELNNYKLVCRACDKSHPAAQRARLSWFRIHDWRHHWAGWFIMDGGNGPALMALGGWKTPKMVQRYVKLSVGHLNDQLARSQPVRRTPARARKR